MWSKGGLSDELMKAFGGDRYSANVAAQQMSIQSLRRVPFSVLRVAALTYREYRQNPSKLHGRLLSEQGTSRALEPVFLRTLEQWFNLHAPIPATMTPSKRYHLIGAPWYIVLALSPLIGLLGVLCCRAQARAAALLICITGAMLLAVSCIAAPEACIRYLHPLVFGTLLGLAVVTDGVLRQFMKLQD